MMLDVNYLLDHVNVRTVLLGIAAFAVLFWLLRRPARKPLPPGPWGWPLLGYLPQLAMAKEPMHEVFAKMSERYGPIVSFSVANQVFVLLQDYDVMKEAFAQHELSGRPQLHISQITLPGYGVLSASGEPWVELRRFAVTALRSLGVGKSSFEEHITTETKCLLEELSASKEKPINPRHVVENAVSNIICSVVFGRRFEYNDVKFRGLLESLGEMFDVLGNGGFVQFVPIFAKLRFLPIVKKLISLNIRMDEILYSMLYNRPLNDPEEEEDPRDFAGLFLKEMNEKSDQGVPTSLTASSLHYTLGDLFGAGTETTSTTLRWAFIFMIAHPKIQARVHREIDEVVGRNRLPRVSDKSELPYTEAVLCEVQRLGSIAPLGVPHRSNEDATLCGYHIPKGAMVISNLWFVMNDPKNWHNPGEFSPGRFLNSDGTLNRQEKNIPFGIGRRVCLGEHLARMELYVAFTCVMHRFTLKSPEGAPPVSLAGCDTGITRSPLAFNMCALPRE